MMHAISFSVFSSQLCEGRKRATHGTSAATPAVADASGFGADRGLSDHVLSTQIGPTDGGVTYTDGLREPRRVRHVF